jgi:ABC-2 type transport system permease protein
MIKAEDFRKNSHIGMLFAIKFMIISEFNAYKTSVAQLIRQILSPVLYFIFLAQGLGALISKISFMGKYVDYKTYVFLGIFAYILITFFSESIYRTTVDKRYGLLAFKLQSGIKPSYYVIGGGIFSAVSMLVQTLILFMVALFFGVKVSLLLYVFGVLFAIVSLYFWRALGVLIAIGIKDYRTRDLILTFGVLPLSFAAPVFYSLDNSPLLIKLVASVNPLTYQIQAIRSIAFGKFSIFYIGISLIITIVTILITNIIINKLNISLSER